MAYICGASSPLLAAPVDISADEMSRDADGVVIARGHVVIKRENETLTADEVRYRVEQMVLEARGHVVISSPQAKIEAEEATMHAGSKTGNMQKAVITLPGGERVTAAAVRRIDDQTFEADELYYSSCPIDEESWRIAATHAVLDQEDGSLNADHARFELWQIPVIYSPWWQQSLRRKTGLLLPSLGAGKRRGTEVSLPLYLAPHESFDMTLTPHWMSARGVMGEGEIRHVSGLGHELIDVRGIRDTWLNRTRSRLRGELDWHLPAGFSLSGQADHVSDRDYLADFGNDTNTLSASYLSSSATLTHGAFGESYSSNWSLQAIHNQNLLLQSNASTLQILPRLQGDVSWRVAENLVLHLDQQTTRFDRRVGVNGWRLDVKPYVEIPWVLSGGGMRATVQAGMRHSRYWLGQTNAVGRQPVRNTPEVSVEVRTDFERVSDAGNLRHLISPLIRYDYVNAPDQSLLPVFDTAWSYLSWSNLLSGNRFSGYDRIENVNRFSAVLENRLQYKDGAGDAPRDLLRVRAGISYDLLRQSVDPALQPVATRPFSNLLGEVATMPTSWFSLGATGQYDPAQRYWAVISAWASMYSKSGDMLTASYQLTDARYFGRSQLLSLTGQYKLLNRWYAKGEWQYDFYQKLSQRTALELRYMHPCWSLGVEGYRLNRWSGASTASSFGFRLIAEFKGMGGPRSN